MIVDTHLHVIDRAALDYPWLSDVEPLDRDWLYETYEVQAKRAGIAKTLHMEVDVAPDGIEAETGYVGRLAARPGSLVVGAIASCRPEDAEFPDYLERQTANPLVKGFRRVLHVMPDALSRATCLPREHPEDDGLRPDLRPVRPAEPVAEGHGPCRPRPRCHLHPRPLRRAGHQGRSPRAMAGSYCRDGQAPERQCEDFRRRCLCGPRNLDRRYPAPLGGARHHSFGWDRVVWGSDWPVCTLGGGLTDWVSATHALLAGASPDERTALLSGNATRIWNL